MTRALALAAALLCGCAHVAELPDGSRRVTGFVSMTVPSIPPEERGADMLEVKALGLLIVNGPAATSVSLGYSADRMTAVRNNALVEIRD